MADTPSDHLTLSQRLREEASYAFDIYHRTGMAPSENTTIFGEQIAQSGLDHWKRLEEAQANETVHHAYRLAHWFKWGCNVFQLTHGLAAGLLLTDPPPLTLDKWHLPFPAFVLTIPEGTVPMFLGDRQVWTDSIWISSFVGYANREDIGTGTETTFYRIDVCFENLTLWRYRRLESLALLDERIENVEYAVLSEGDPPKQDEDSISIGKAVHLIRNFLSWLDSTGGTTRHSPESRSKQKQKGDAVETTPTTWIFGREVKLQPEIRRMATEVALGHTRGAKEGWKVRMRHVVRGHRKEQPFGAGRAERREIWICPYWRGPEGEAAWAHLYTPKEEK